MATKVTSLRYEGSKQEMIDSLREIADELESGVRSPPNLLVVVHDDPRAGGGVYASYRGAQSFNDIYCAGTLQAALHSVFDPYQYGAEE